MAKYYHNQYNNIHNTPMGIMDSCQPLDRNVRWFKAPWPDGYAVPTYAPKSNNDGWASTKGCKEPGCNAHWIIGGTGYCIMHSKE